MFEERLHRYYCDLYNEVFNTDYYIIGTYHPKALKNTTFQAIERVQTYEKENFGELYTDSSDPEKVINMLFTSSGKKYYGKCWSTQKH